MSESLKLLVIDVDGTLTDAGIYYDEHGNELKKFCTKDAAGIFAARKCGIKTMILTGRECAATSRRMTELKVDYLIQNVKDKVAYLRKFMDENSLSKKEVGYIGDDLNDISSMMLCGYIGCPQDACIEVKKLANYIANVPGAHGAVRDVVEHMLRECKLWESAVKEVYRIGV